MENRWPTKDELKKLQFDENTRAMELNDEPDPICECGMPGYACCCEQIAMEFGYWAGEMEFQYT